MATIIKRVFQVRRDTEENWLAHQNIIPAAGEPCLTLDGHYAGQVKFGDGVKSWGELNYTGVAEFQTDGLTVEITDGIVGIAGASTASAGQGFRIAADGTSIEWFDAASKEDVLECSALVGAAQKDIAGLRDILSNKVDARNVYTRDEIDEIVKGAFHYRGTISSLSEVSEPHSGDVYQLSSGGFKVFDGDSWEDFGVDIDLNGYSTIESANAIYEKVQYEISSVPKGTIVDYRDKEIRILCPPSAVFTKQQVGSGGNSDMYYMAFIAYAPDGAASFMEDDQDGIKDETMHYFANNSFAGIDRYGRQYSITWLPIAQYDEASGEWNYFGATSTIGKYVGWHYTVKWYDTDGNLIGGDKIRINLSNESCHDELKPSYLADIMKSSVNGVLLDGDELAIVDHKVNIPLADSQRPGVVRSSEGDNKVFVNPDGTMEIKSISWSILTQEDGETIYIDGGNASV